MVNLPLLFQLCGFTPAFSKQREGLPPFREYHLTVSKLLRKDKFAHVDLLQFSKFLFYFTLVLKSK
jgi:hypothetical protein